MDIERVEVGKYHVLIVNERLDLYNMSEFKKLLFDIIEEQSAFVALEMRGNAFDFPSAAIGALVGAHKKISVSGGQLVLLNPTVYILDLLTLAGLRDLFPTADNVQMLVLLG